jgi:hypothetical protein
MKIKLAVTVISIVLQVFGAQAFSSQEPPACPNHVGGINFGNYDTKGRTVVWCEVSGSDEVNALNNDPHSAEAGITITMSGCHDIHRGQFAVLLPGGKNQIVKIATDNSRMILLTRLNGKVLSSNEQSLSFGNAQVHCKFVD